jgi:hypothetical protein
MKAFSPKQYVSALADFIKEFEVHPLVKMRITDQEQIVDLFRFWWMDCREREIIQDAMDEKDNDPYGFGKL